MQVHEKSILMPMHIVALLSPLEGHMAALMLPASVLSMFPLLVRDGQGLPYLALTAAASILLPMLAEQGCIATHGRPGKPAAAERQAHSSASEGGASHVDDLSNGSTGTALQSSVTRPVTRRMARQRAQHQESSVSPATDQHHSSCPQISTPGAKVCWHRAVAQCAWEAVPRELQQLIRSWLEDPRQRWQQLCNASRLGLLLLHTLRALLHPPLRQKWLHDLLMVTFAFAHFAPLLLYSTWRQWQLWDDAG